MDTPKILWSSVSPELGHTGYSKVTANLLPRFKERGIDVMVHGYQGKGLASEFHGVPTLPNGKEKHGEDVIPGYMARYQRDVLISLYDSWILLGYPQMSLPWVAYTPIDALPVTDMIRGPLQYATDIISFCKFGQDALKQAELESTIIPHGVDTDIFHLLDEESKAQAKRRIGLKPTDFLVGTVCTNLYDRKDIPRMLKVFSMFIKKSKARDAYFFLLTQPDQELGIAYSLPDLAYLYNVENFVRYPSVSPFIAPLSEKGMNELYNAFDVYLSLSRAEGFNLPLLEAGACGVPSIFTDYSAPPSWYPDEASWKVPVIDTIVSLTTPLHNEWALADPNKAVDALMEAYENRKLLKKKGEVIQEFAQTLTWDKVTDNYWLPYFKNRLTRILTEPYSKSYFIRRKAEDRIINNFAPLKEVIGSDENILELGCGDGEFLRYISLGGKRVAGCDIASFAKTMCASLPFKTCDANTRLPYKDNEFDTVISMHLLEHLYDDKSAIMESLRVAKTRAIHLVPLGLRPDWTHKRIYTAESIQTIFHPDKIIILGEYNDAILIFDKAWLSRELGSPKVEQPQ